MHWTELWPILADQWATSNRPLKKVTVKQTAQPDFVFRYDAELGRHRLCWDYLRVSPSYWLVHQAAKGERKVTAAERKRLNLAPVERTYSVMGNVYTSDFKSWYRRTGRPAFASGYQLMPTVVARWDSVEAVSRPQLRDLNQQLKKQMAGVSQRTADCGGVVVFIPAAGDIYHIAMYLQHQLQLERRNLPSWMRTAPNQLDYELDHTSKHQVLNLWQNLALLRYRAENWQLKVWQVAAGFARMGWDSERAIHLDPVGERRTDSEYDKRNRRILTAQLDARFATTLRLAENAARGQFPSTQAVEGINDWDWHQGRLWERLRL